MVCLTCLKELSTTAGQEHHDSCLRRLFDTTAVRSRLAFTRAEVFQDFRAIHTRRMSISGVQPKLMLHVEDKELRPVATGGRYILKPSPESFPGAAENEHVSMLLGALAGVDTPTCSLVRFADGELAYLVRRFDRAPNGDKIHQEDLTQILAISRTTDGEFKYGRSYEEVGETIYTATDGKLGVVLRFFERVVFNYLIKNGDYHLKNISLRRGPGTKGLSYTDLTPNYDSLNTSLYSPKERVTALDMYKDGEYSSSYQMLGFHCQVDFVELGRRMGLPTKAAVQAISKVVRKKDQMKQLLRASYMAPIRQAQFIADVDERAMALGMVP